MSKPRVPFYLQVYDSLFQEIKSGKINPMEKVPSEWQLPIEYGVSRTVIRQASGALYRDKFAVCHPDRRSTRICNPLPCNTINIFSWMLSDSPERTIRDKAFRMFEKMNRRVPSLDEDAMN